MISKDLVRWCWGLTDAALPVKIVPCVRRRSNRQIRRRRRRGRQRRTPHVRAPAPTRPSINMRRHVLLVDGRVLLEVRVRLRAAILPSRQPLRAAAVQTRVQRRYRRRCRGSGVSCSAAARSMDSLVGPAGVDHAGVAMSCSGDESPEPLDHPEGCPRRTTRLRG